MMRPVILVGKGAECPELPRVLELGIPVLTSWQAIDLLDNDHHLNYGRPGIYGQRAANYILSQASHVLSLGCRCSLWMVGYNWNPMNLSMIDVDQDEMNRYPNAQHIKMNAAEYLGTMEAQNQYGYWIHECDEARKQYPWLEGEKTFDGYINPYWFIHELSKMFKHDQIVTTDTGTPYIVAHQILKIKRPQRLIASGGLSEMGAGLPGAIGACIGSGREVLMMSGDGGFMMNIQELATVRTKQLPIKMIVFNNGGYNMIRRTQENLRLSTIGTGEPDISMPSFARIARAHDIAGIEVRTWDDFWRLAPWFMQAEGPMLMELFTSPKQPLLKLNPSKNEDGTFNSPEFWDLTFKNVA